MSKGKSAHSRRGSIGGGWASPPKDVLCLRKGREEYGKMKRKMEGKLRGGEEKRKRAGTSDDKRFTV